MYLGIKFMPLSIKDPETERLARDLARRTGESITVATRKALQERLRRVRSADRRFLLLDDLAAIRQLLPATGRENTGRNHRL